MGMRVLTKCSTIITIEILTELVNVYYGLFYCSNL